MATKSLCSIPNCDKAIHSRGLCPAHYRKWRLYGDPKGGRAFIPDDAVCKFEGCDKKVRSRGWCTTHYSRWLTNGDASIVLVPANGTLADWVLHHADWQDDACLIWPFSRMPKGYACTVTMDGEKTYAHRHMCRLVHGEPLSSDMDTAHSCGNGHLGCINPRHLRWATRTENMADQIEHGRTQRGSKSVGSKLNEDDIAAIMHRLAAGETQRCVAAHFGVTQSAISAINRKKNWGWMR